MEDKDKGLTIRLMKSFWSSGDSVGWPAVKMSDGKVHNVDCNDGNDDDE